MPEFLKKLHKNVIKKTLAYNFFPVVNLFLFDMFLLQLDDPFQRLAQGDGLPVAVVEVEGVREVRGGLEESVELSLHHVVLVLLGPAQALFLRNIWVTVLDQ